MRLPAEQLPWNVAVPIKPSSFTPLRARDSVCNVEVDLGRIGAFSNRKTSLPEREVLYADLQLNADVNHDRRLGSGRAGRYAGRYLKGVGRTLLAANWNNPYDLYHRSGLLLASGGARELLVSEYVKRLGLAHTIVPCDGVLARRMPAGFRGHLRNMFGSPKLDYKGIDSRLQMISVKPAGFARLSNFVWWLCAFPQNTALRSPLGLLLQLFYDALEPEQTGGGSPGAEAIAERFARMSLRGIDNFLAAWRQGITWGSVPNNFTADGRFLDLETPCVLGGPFVGSQYSMFRTDGPAPERVRLETPGYFFGLEVVRYVHQLRVFAQFMIAHLRFMAGQHLTSPSEAQFIDQFIAAFTWHLTHTCPLLSLRGMSRIITDKLCAALEPTRSQRQLLRCMVMHAFEGSRFLEQSRGPAGFAAYKQMSFVKLDCDDLAPIEPSFRLQLYVPEFLRDRVQPFKARSQVFQDGLRAIDRSKDVDDCLATIAAEVRKIRRIAPA